MTTGMTMKLREAMRVWVLGGALVTGMVACGDPDEEDDGDATADIIEDAPGDVGADSGADTSEDTGEGDVAGDVGGGEVGEDVGEDAVSDAGDAGDAADDAEGDAGSDAEGDAADDAVADAEGDSASDADPDAEVGADATDLAQDLGTPDASFSDGDLELGDGGCPPERPLWADIQLEDYTQIPELEDLDFDEVTPALETAYWELRFGFFDDPPTVLGSSGTLCADAGDAGACEASFEALTSDTGFGVGCMPGYCFYYLAVNQGDSSFIVTDAAGLVDFFGGIDTPTEAILLARGHGYGWYTTEVEAGGYRKDEGDGSWRLLVTELVRGCDPVITDRVDLSIGTDGTVTRLRNHALSVLCRACI